MNASKELKAITHNRKEGYVNCIVFCSFFYRIEIKYILSRPPDEWTGLRGRINKDILVEFLGDIDLPSTEEELLICVCGPDEFTEMING